MIASFVESEALDHSLSPRLANKYWMLLLLDEPSRRLLAYRDPPSHLEFYPPSLSSLPDTEFSQHFGARGASISELSYGFCRVIVSVRRVLVGVTSASIGDITAGVNITPFPFTAVPSRLYCKAAGDMRRNGKFSGGGFEQRSINLLGGHYASPTSGT